jgi:hypothetical protein
LKKSALVLLSMLCCAFVVAMLACSDLATTDTTSMVAPETTTVTEATATPPEIVTPTWTQLQPGGPFLLDACSQSHLFYDPASNKVLLVGGYAGVSLLYTCEYDLAANTWTDINIGGAYPFPRFRPHAVYDPEVGAVIFYGGRDDNTGGVLHDTWVYQWATSTWTEVQTVGEGPACEDSSFVWDPDGHRVIAFGGVVHEMFLEDAKDWQETMSSDTWAYDPVTSTWTRLDPAGPVPAARWGASIGYDPTTRRVILYGGDGAGENTVLMSDDISLYDTWAYDPASNTWTELSPTFQGLGGAMPAVRAATLHYDPALGQMVCAYEQSIWLYDPAANTWTELGYANQLAPERWGASGIAYDATAHQVILYGGEGPSGYLGDTWLSRLVP